MNNSLGDISWLTRTNSERKSEEQGEREKGGRGRKRRECDKIAKLCKITPLK